MKPASLTPSESEAAAYEDSKLSKRKNPERHNGNWIHNPNHCLLCLIERFEKNKGKG